MTILLGWVIIGEAMLFLAFLIFAMMWLIERKPIIIGWREIGIASIATIFAAVLGPVTCIALMACIT